MSQRAEDAVARHDLAHVRAEVVLVLDTSKSMYAMYKSNMVAELATRVLALSLQFDDDGVIPAYAFGEVCRHLSDLRADDFPGWIEREVIRTGADFQNACKYAPVIHEICSYYFPEDWHKPTSEVRTGRIFKKTATVYPTLSAPRVNPVYVLFVTGGDCQDKIAATDAVRRSSRLPIFWQFIGLQPTKGPQAKFKFLEKLDALGNTHVDNAGFFEASDTRDDKVLFEGMCKEFPNYLARAEVKAMLASEAAGGKATKGKHSAAPESTVIRSTEDVPDVQAEATRTVAPHKSRLLAAAEPTRVNRARETINDDGEVELTPTQLRRLRRQQAAEPIADNQTVMRQAIDDDDELAAVQDESTRMITVQPEDDDGDSIEAARRRIEAIKARRQRDR